MPQSNTRSQPLSRLGWVPVEDLRANNYNPNKVFAPELRLLKLSLLENGWTQPIVVIPRDDGTYEIVDGYHRFTLASTDAEVFALTAGFVPIVPLLVAADRASQLLATIRHNRARGVHGVLPMAEIVRELVDEHGMPEDEIRRRLQMDAEEVDRLYDRGGMTERGSAPAFNPGWTPR